jgi:V8-like Glu-specific endopeptidase
MAWKYTPLANTLAGLYYRTNQIETLLLNANFKPEKFVIDNSPANVIWTMAIKTIVNLNRVPDIIHAALQDYPDNPILKDFAAKDDTSMNSVYAGKEPDWNPKVNKKEFEKITGDQSTLLPISFLEIGLAKARAVARIVTPDGLGTGFLISNTDLLLTNHHVIGEKPKAGEWKAQFNYQKTAAGLPAQYEEFEIDDSVFETSADDDWTVVKVKGNPSAKYGFLPLKDVKLSAKEFVNIIQHPGGEHKQIGLYHNLTTFVNDDVVQYLTDTLPGSSGSPAFNSKWEVVALHHSGGWLEEPGNGGPPALRNEGININKIIKSLKEKALLN